MVVASNFICAFVVDGALCSEVLPSTFAQFTLQVAGSVSASALKAICLRSCIVRKGVRLGRVCNKFSFHFFAVFSFVCHLLAKLFPLQYCCPCSCLSCCAVFVKFALQMVKNPSGFVVLCKCWPPVTSDVSAGHELNRNSLNKL